MYYQLIGCWQDRFAMMTRPYYRNSHAAVVVCDVTRSTHPNSSTHTHTHTHIYIYIYIHTPVGYSPWLDAIAILVLTRNSKVS